MTGPFRPGPPPGARPRPSPGPRPGPPSAASYEEVGEAHHPAVDAAVQAMVNAEGLPPADQIAQYEAAYQTLRETLATIDQT
ncbi:hypothetical protein [Micromonospora halophytica]|uniref:Uncharacterized protein n=1 Tax=Micromonospora halophytica TaxID=47864 RepID=A0A1C5HTI8_9ACTN|nr:hypothetical protein [Micromonospora halophytica]SCG49310.1 hypothetical protein GA0070560_1068 [Micromonospora halophytica]